MINVLGFDCSSKTVHMVELSPDGQIVRMEKWASGSKDAEIRFDEILDQFEDWFDGQVAYFIPEKLAVVIENAIYVQNIKATNYINHVIAGVKRHMHKREIQRFGIDNRVWKKDVLGNGNASKENILQFAKTKWGDVFPEQDFADAACIAFWGVKRFGK